MKDSQINGIDTPNIKVTKIDKNNYTIKADPVDVPTKFVITTEPELLLEAIELQKEMTLVDNVLTVGKTYGPIVIQAGEGKCAEYINISFSQLS